MDRTTDVGRASSPHRASALFLVLAIASQAQQIRMEPPHDSGQSVTGAFEGWFPNADGTFSILLGYYNRNNKQELDIPIGPDNKIEPGGPDQSQPTHFLTGRQWGVFTVTVPKDFGSKKLTWTLTANGTTTSIPLNLGTLWELSPMKDATNNTPPFLGFTEKGPFVQGPRGQTDSVVTTALKPTRITLWVADDANISPGAPHLRAPAVTLGWSKFRGPGSVTFSKEHPEIDLLNFAAPPHTVFHGKAITDATFSEPGEYVLRVQANDWSGEGGRGFQCCWSNAEVKVSVKPAAH